MRTGECVSAAPGRTSDKVYDLDAAFVMGAIRANVEPHPNYRARNYALFTNGVWRRNEYCGSDTSSIGICYPVDQGSTVNATVAVIEVGDQESFDENYFVPGGWVKEEEATDAARIRIHWEAGYLVDEGYGDSSLASVTLTGVQRNGNCYPDDNYANTRYRISYTIEDVSGTRIVRLWNGLRLVASGSRAGDGLISFVENNGSGLTGQAIITYTADVVPGQAYVLLRWPAAYNIHYSTNPLVYPRTPEMVVYDVGVMKYVALTPILPAGSYNYSVQAVGDDSVEQSPVAVPTDSPKLIKSPPLPGTITGATGNAVTGVTVTWTPGEPGCSWFLYYSLVDEPVNIGQWPLPSPILRPVGASSAILAPIINYAPLDRTPAWTAFLATIDDVVANANSAYDAGWTLYDATLTTERARAIAAIQTLSNATGIPTPEHYERFGMQFDGLINISYGAPTSGSVQSGHLGNASVVSGSIASGQIGINHFASGIAITSGMITSGDLGAFAVTSASIGSGQIGWAHINSGMILNVNIASGAVASANYASGSISTFKIASGQILNANIASGAVASANYASGSISTFKIASGQILNVNIASGAVASANYASGSISTFKLADGTITSALVASGAIAFAVPSFSGQPAGTVLGLITLDEMNNRIWVCTSGGNWRYAALT